jgi:hypothetical protein
MAQREAARIADAWATDGVHKWMAYDRLSGALVGRGGLSRAHVAGQDRLEIGWALLRTCWGHGYATEIGRAGLAFAFDELAADEVVSYTEARNARSRAVMERLGFQYTTDIILEDGSEPFALYQRIGLSAPAFRHGGESPVARRRHQYPPLGCLISYRVQLGYEDVRVPPVSEPRTAPAVDGLPHGVAGHL